MKKRYLVVGLGVATLAAVTIVIVGIGPEARTGTLARATALSSPGVTLPSGHPSVSSTPTDAPSASETLRRTIAQLEAAHAAHPRDISVLLKLGDADFLVQRYKEAGQAYRQAQLLAPSNTTATVRLAMVWYAQDHADQAVKAITAVIAKTPGDQEAHYSLAIIYFSEGHRDDARYEWAAAAKIDPSSTIGRRSQSFVDLLEGRQTAKSGTGD